MSSVAHLALLQRHRPARDLPQLRKLLTSARAMRAAVATSFYADFARFHAQRLVEGYDASRARSVAALCSGQALRSAHPLAEVQDWLALLLHAALKDARNETRDEDAKRILGHQLRELQRLTGRLRPRRLRCGGMSI